MRSAAWVGLSVSAVLLSGCARFPGLEAWFGGVGASSRPAAASSASYTGRRLVGLDDGVSPLAVDDTVRWPRAVSERRSSVETPEERAAREWHERHARDLWGGSGPVPVAGPNASRGVLPGRR